MANTIEIVLKSVDEMSADLKKVQASLAQMDKGATKTAESTEELSGAAKEGGKAVEGLNTAMTTLGAVLSPVNADLNRFFGLVSNLQRNIGAVGVALFAAGLFGMAKAAADAGTELSRTAQVTGITVENLSALKLAAETSESSLGELSVGLRIFNRELSQAITIGGAAQKQFLDLGITNAQLVGYYEDTGAALEEVAKRIIEAGSAAKQTELATRFFGRAGRELLPLLREIADQGLEGVRKKAEEAGLVIGKDAADAARKFNDNLTKLGQTVKGFIFDAFAPFLKAVNEFVDNHGAVVRAIGGITAGLAALATVLALIKSLSAGGFLLGLLAAGGATLLTGPGLLAAAIIGVGTALYFLSKANKETTDTIPQLNAKLDDAKERLNNLEEAGAGASKAAKELREEIEKLAETAAAKQAKIKQLVDTIAFLQKTNRGDSALAKSLQEQLNELSGEALRPHTDEPLQEAKEDYKELSEAAKKMLIEIKTIGAESQKQLAQIALGNASRLLEEGGNLKDFLEESEKQIERLRRATLVPIQLKFEEELATSGPSGVSQDVVRQKFGAQVAQVNIQFEQQRRELALKAQQVYAKTDADRLTATQALIKAEQALANIRIETAQRALDLDLGRIESLDEIVSKSKIIADAQSNAIRRELEALQDRRGTIIAEIQELESGADAPNSPRFIQLTAEATELQAQIEKLGLSLKNVDAVIAAMVKKFNDFRKLGLDIDTTKVSTEIDALQDKLKNLETAQQLGVNVPFSQFLDLAKAIDAAQARITANKIKELEIDREALIVQQQRERAGREESATTQRQIDAATASLVRLQQQAVFSATERTDARLQELQAKINDIASSTAKNFVDRLIEGLESGENRFQDFFKNMGRTLFADLLQESLKQGLKGVLEKQAIETGEKPADTMGGQLLQQIRYLFGNVFGIEFAKTIGKASDPLLTAGTEMNTAAQAHKEAATDLKAAATSLSGLAPGGVNVVSQGPASPFSEPLGEFAKTLAAYDRLDAEHGAMLRESGGPSSSMAGVGGASSLTGLNSLLPGGMGLITGIGALTANGGGAAGILNKIGGGASSLKGILDIYQSLSKLFSTGAGAASSGGGFLDSILGLFGLGGGGGSSGGGFFDFIGSLFGGLFGGAANGAMIGPAQLGTAVSSGAIRKFRAGDMVRGPTLGVLGEEGPEIVARMKPAGAHDSGGGGGGEITQTLWVVDQRRPNLGPNEIELVIEDSMNRGRGVSKAVTNVIKRNRRG